MLLTVKTAWIISQIINATKMGFDFSLVVSLFELLIVQIKNSKVASVVSPKISDTNAGKFCIILTRPKKRIILFV
jgi:hypothetical protein